MRDDNLNSSGNRYTKLDSFDLSLNKKKSKVQNYEETPKKKSSANTGLAYSSNPRYKQSFDINFATYYKKAYMAKNNGGENSHIDSDKGEEITEFDAEDQQHNDFSQTQRVKIRQNATNDFPKLHNSGSSGRLSYLQKHKTNSINNSQELAPKS